MYLLVIQSYSLSQLWEDLPYSDIDNKAKMGLKALGLEFDVYALESSYPLELCGLSYIFNLF